MNVVGIKELKARLSSFISLVRKGGQIVITDHGEEVALITPLSEEYRAIRFIVSSGRAQWAGGKPQGMAKRITVKGGPLSGTVLEERE